MKIVISAFLVAGVLLQVVSKCNPSYTCGRQCYQYNNGTIVICRTSYADANQFAQTADSLRRIYGTGVAFFADSVTVNGGSANTVNSVTNQLQSQGYTCVSN